MIILYDESEKEFTTLGLGVLKDVISAKVEEKLNDIFELTIEYPITGDKYSKIKIGRIIAAKPNPYDEIQPFRISSITKPIKGIVTIFCEHISYDANGIPCKAIDALNLNDAINKIQENMIVKNNFKIVTDIQFSRKFKTNAPYNLRALLMGDEKESLIGVYNAELKFNKYSVMLYSKRGKNRGAKVCYGNNMTDLQHESTNERLYNGVFPYYHKETESTETTSENSFTKAYIVGSKPFQDGWLSFSKNGDAYHPVDSTPIQIDTEGEYYEKIYSWNSTYQKYEEKVYNASVSLIEGVTEPSWIYIDWSKFPNVVCKANKKGYFKTMTETDWGEIKGVGDIIFEGNVLTGGLTNMTDNMVIYYSEVLPPNHSASSETTVTSVDVILDDPVIHVDTSDAKTMKYDKILSLDLTSQFEEEPTKEKLKAKAEEYIVKNLVGTIKHTTTVSFIDLASTTDRYRYQNFDHIELGDTVKVIYKDLGVDVDLRVISTEYDALKGTYTNIELGEKKDNFSSQSIQNGDNISSLSNDVGYADITTVNKLIADTVTADYLQAVNATMSKAQIEYLQVAKISCPGILEASQLVLDELVAKMLIADNAKISETLEAGTIKVAGDISITSGSINITDNGSTSFIVDREGNVTANSVAITGGTFNINDGMFEVTNDGTLYSKDAFVEGEIVATSGKIGNCTIDEEGILHVPGANINGTITAVDIVGGSINIGRIGSTSNYNFTVDEYGSVNANSLAINGGSIKIGPISGTNPTQYNFEVNTLGEVKAKSIEITGGKITLSSGATSFEVDDNGNLEANSVTLTGGTIENLNITGTLYFDNTNAIIAYIRGQHIQYRHEPRFVMDQSAALQDLEACEVVLPFVNYNGNSLDDSGFYLDDCFDVPTDIFIDVERMEEYGMKIVSQQLPEDTDLWFHIYYHDRVTVWDITSVNGVDYTTEREQDVLEITADTVTDLTSYTSSWLSTHDPSIDGQDGEPLTPNSYSTYMVYDDSGRTPGHQRQFIGMYKWIDNKFVKVSSDNTYCIKQDGVHLPGIDATVSQTKIAGFTVDDSTLVASNSTLEVGLSSNLLGYYAIWAGKANQTGEHPFSVTHLGEITASSGKIGDFNINNCLTTNASKTTPIQLLEGLYLGADGIGFYDYATSSRTSITATTGLCSTKLLCDPLKANYSKAEYAGAPTILNIRSLDLFSEQAWEDGSSQLRVGGYDYEPNWQRFISTIPSSSRKGFVINAQTTRVVSFDGSGWGIPDYPLGQGDITIENIFVSQVFLTEDDSHYDPQFAIAGYDNIIVSWKNDTITGKHTIYVKNENSRKVRVSLLIIMRYEM